MGFRSIDERDEHAQKMLRYAKEAEKAAEKFEGGFPRAAGYSSLYRAYKTLSDIADNDRSNDSGTRDLVNTLNRYFQNKVKVPRVRMGEQQEIETLISEEASLFAQFLRNEKENWFPRIALT